MTRLLESLSPSVRYWLSSLARLEEDMDWPACLARSEGWRVANKAYQAEQRKLGATEMQALLGHLNLEPPMDPATDGAIVLADDRRGPLSGPPATDAPWRPGVEVPRRASAMGVLGSGRRCRAAHRGPTHELRALLGAQHLPVGTRQGEGGPRRFRAALLPLRSLYARQGIIPRPCCPMRTCGRRS